MKKLVALMLALCMIACAFAEDVAIKLEKFSGEASLDWSFDLNSQKFGLTNANKTELEMSFFSEKSKKTKGTGIWGELVIKSKENKIPYEIDDPEHSGTKKTMYDFRLLDVEVDKADIHLLNGDYLVTLGILKPDFLWESIQLPTALKADAVGAKQRSVEEMDAGFKLSVENKIIDVFVTFGDNGVKKADAKKFGFTAEALIKPVKNFNFGGGLAYSKDKFSFKANLAANFDLTDALYLRTAAGFANGDKEIDPDNAPGVKKHSNIVGVGALLGWGKKGVAQSLMNVKNRAGDVFFENSDGDAYVGYEGVSANVFFQTLPDDDWVEVELCAFDASLLPGFTFGAVYDMFITENATHTDNLAAAVKYTKAFGIFDFETNVGYMLTMASKDKKVNDSTIFFDVSLSTSQIIQNTSLYLKYTDFAKDFGEDPATLDNKGTITVGTKISL